MTDIAPNSRRLEKPPIVEVLLAICGPSTADWNVATLPRTIQSALPEYPEVELFNAASVNIQILPETSSPGGLPATATGEFADRGWHGIRLATKGPERAVVIQRDHVVLSWLAPYPGWTALIDEMLRIWSVLGPILQFSKVDRVETRYVNQLDVPIENGWVDFRSYYPGIGEAPAGLAWGPFLNQMVLGVPNDSTTHVTLVRMAQPAANTLASTVPLVLDLVATKLESGSTDETRLRAVFERLHDIKNQVFFASVSEKYTELCKP